jgi:hypothetical protein
MLALRTEQRRCRTPKEIDAAWMATPMLLPVSSPRIRQNRLSTDRCLCAAKEVPHLEEGMLATDKIEDGVELLYNLTGSVLWRNTPLLTFTAMKGSSRLVKLVV